MSRPSSHPAHSAPDPVEKGQPSFTAFAGFRRIAAGSLPDVALAVKRFAASATEPAFVYADETGDLADLDLRGTDEEVAARYAGRADAQHATAGSAEGEGSRAGPRRRGRPALGVVGREVTLLPRHWEWLNAQPGGASVALRKLVEQARRSNQESDLRRVAQARAYRFMSLVAGDLAGFEEAGRALFAGDRARFEAIVSAWPPDVAEQVTRLGFTQ